MKVCQQDISTHCKGVFREEADVHECLRHRLNDLSPQCLALEKETLEAEAEDLSRSVLVMKHCKPPMARYCSESFGKGGSASPATASPEALLSEGSKIEGNSDTLTCLVAQAELLGLSLTGDKPGRTGGQDPHTGADRSTLRGTSGAITGADSAAAGQTGSASGSDHSFGGKCLEELGHLRPFVDEALLRAVLERERSATEKVTLVSSQPNPGVSAKQIAKIVSRSHEQGSSFFEVRDWLASLGQGPRSASTVAALTCCSVPFRSEGPSPSWRWHPWSESSSTAPIGSFTDASCCSKATRSWFRRNDTFGWGHGPRLAYLPRGSRGLGVFS